MRRLKPVPLTTRPRVSVVIPCYNYGHFLPQAVASALDQDHVDVDVLIVDDASTDGGAEVALGMAGSDPRVDVLLHEANRGHIATYNDGLSKVSGAYVALLSADDVLTRNSLTRSVALMEANPTVGLAYGHPESFASEFAVAPPRRVSWTVWEGSTWLRRVCARGRNIILNPEAVMRRSVLDQVGGYDEAHPHAADMLLWMRAAARADVGRVNGVVQAGYREHGQNMHSTTFAGALTDFREVRRAFEELFSSGDLPPDMVSRLSLTAMDAMAREALLYGRAARRRGAADEAAAYARFAGECLPRLRSSHAYQQLQPWTPAMSAAERAVVERLDSLRWAARWRRWRRWGT